MRDSSRRPYHSRVPKTQKCDINKQRSISSAAVDERSDEKDVMMKNQVG